MKNLTQRQVQVLELFAKGINAKSIAFFLKITVRTVLAHKYNACHLLNARNIENAIYVAAKKNII